MKKKLIGKGLFSRVYFHPENETQVIIESEDFAKECLALFVDNDCFPKLKRVDYGVYETEYYPKVKSLKESLKPEYYQIYKELRELSIKYTRNKYDLWANWYGVFEELPESEYKAAILEFMDEINNYSTQVHFEISPRNVAVKEGKLILLDCFFCEDQAEQFRNKTKANKTKVYMC